MEFRLLGTVSVDTHRGALPLGPAKRRSVLAALLLSPNSPVSVGRLTECLWEDEPPRLARGVIQGHISRLRALLVDADARSYGVELVTLPDAYLLELPESLLDAQRFEELLALAAEQADPADAALMLADALSLWQGPALAGAFAGPPLQAAALMLEESRLAAVEQLARAWTTAGEPARAVALLRAEAPAHPLREPLAAALMLALYRTGRQSEALARYHRIRHLLADELGIDPGPELTDTYALILRGEPGTVGPPPGGTPPWQGPSVRGAARAESRGMAAQAAAYAPGLTEAPAGGGPRTAGPGRPADSPGSSGSPWPGTAGFAEAPPLGAPWPEGHGAVGGAGTGGPTAAPGRAAEGAPARPGAGPVAQPPLVGGPHPTDLLPRAPRGFQGRGAELDALTTAATGEAPVCLLTGPAGVGKTALALHWAHAHAARFPDGRLFADLHGFGDAGEPGQGEVLREFLLALGVPPRRVPESVPAAAALYRGLTETRRLLVVLDNVRDSAAVRALLPAGPGCVTLVTSRHRLEGLIATDAAQPLPIGTLDPRQGVALLTAVLGAERVAAEPGAARRLAELCGGLPLALRVTAARLAGRPQWTLTRLADELADERSRLAYLDVDDTGVSAALRLTVQQLPADAVHQLARLGHHPGVHADPYTAAALAGTDPRRARSALDRLADAHLATETAPDRWELHDLVRLYARDLDPDSARTALVNVLDHFVVTALAAAETAEPGGEPCFELPEGFQQPAAVQDFSDRAAAVQWFAAEREDLARAVAAARAAGLDDRAWRIILLQWPLIVWRVRDGWLPLLELALDCARAERDPYAESRVRALLGWVLSEEGRPGEAATMLEPAPDLARLAGDRLGEATALINLALLQAEQGDPDAALENCDRALALVRADGHTHTEMLALQHLARIRLTAGQPEQALAIARAALDLGPEHEEAARRALLLAVGGEAQLALGEREEGLRLLERAAAEAESAGFDEGAVQALSVLLRETGSSEHRRRHAEAGRRLTGDA